MDLLGKQLDKWFIETEFTNDHFPYHNQDDYKKKFDNITSQLNKKVHPYVNSGAMVHDDGMLTDHGPEHIRMLIDRLTSFIDGNQYITLTPYEVYILLMCAHIHDAGNIFGRVGHPDKAQYVI